MSSASTPTRHPPNTDITVSPANPGDASKEKGTSQESWDGAFPVCVVFIRMIFEVVVQAFALERRLDFKSPGFKQCLRNILGIPVAARPFAQASRADVLIRGELEFLYNLLKG